MGARWPSAAGMFIALSLGCVGVDAGDVAMQLLDDVGLLLDLSGVVLRLCLLKQSFVFVNFSHPFRNLFVVLFTDVFVDVFPVR